MKTRLIFLFFCLLAQFSYAAPSPFYNGVTVGPGTAAPTGATAGSLTVTSSTAAASGSNSLVVSNSNITLNSSNPNGIVGQVGAGFTGNAPGLTSGSAASSGTGTFNLQGNALGSSGTGPTATVQLNNGPRFLASNTVLYATQWGAVADSTAIATGTNGQGLSVGTSSTANTIAIQNAENYLQSIGGGTLVLDGSGKAFSINGVLVTGTHAAAILMANNSILKGSSKGSGLMLSASSNCTMLSNFDITGSSNYTDNDFEIDDVVINGYCGPPHGPTPAAAGTGTCAYQSRWELGSASNGWNLGIFFSGFHALYMHNVSLRDITTFGCTVGNGYSVYLDHCGLTEDWGHDFNYNITPGSSLAPGCNWDFVHVWSPMFDVTLRDCSDTGGDDDPIALNTDEGYYSGVIVNPGGFATYRYPQYLGVTQNFETYNLKLNNTCNCERIYGIGGYAGTTIGNFTDIDTTGTCYADSNYQSVNGTGTLTIHGRKVWSTYDNIWAIFNSGTAYTTTQCQTYGNNVTSSNLTLQAYPMAFIYGYDGTTLLIDLETGNPTVEYGSWTGSGAGLTGYASAFESGLSAVLTGTAVSSGTATMTASGLLVKYGTNSFTIISSSNSASTATSVTGTAPGASPVTTSGTSAGPSDGEVIVNGTNYYFGERVAWVSGLSATNSKPNFVTFVPAVAGYYGVVFETNISQNTQDDYIAPILTWQDQNGTTQALNTQADDDWQDISGNYYETGPGAGFVWESHPMLMSSGTIQLTGTATGPITGTDLQMKLNGSIYFYGPP